MGKDMSEIKAVCEETNNTMITVTHDKRAASALCDYAVWIKDRKVYKAGKKELTDEFFLNDTDKS